MCVLFVERVFQGFKLHQKTHSQVRDHLCCDCGKSFSTSRLIDRNSFRDFVLEKDLTSAHIAHSFYIVIINNL